MPCIIGIDPGSRLTGYGVVEGDGSRFRHIANGTIRMADRIPFPERLGLIYKQLTSIIAEFNPDGLAVEDVFFAYNVKSALRLGQARGAAIVAGVSAGIPVYEYSALQIKQAVVGYGKAGKDQVGQMIRFLLQLRENVDPDASDALAVAICHLNTSIGRNRLNPRESKQ